MRLRGKVKRVAIGIGAAFCFLLLAKWLLGPRENTYSGFPAVPVITIQQLDKGSPFVGQVLSFYRGMRGPSVDASVSNREARSGDEEYLLIDFQKEGGRKLCLDIENPTTNGEAFFSSLVEGQKYRFPDVVREWESKGGVLGGSSIWTGQQSQPEGDSSK